MSAYCNFRPHSPLKTVFNKLEDTYQAYCNTYKNHARATHHGGAGQPLEREDAQQGQDTDVPNDYYHEDIDNFENLEQENHTTLKILTWDPDDLCHRVQAGKGQPMEAINCIECEFHRLSLALHSSAPPEPLDDVLQQYTETFCSAQRQTTFGYTLI